MDKNKQYLTTLAAVNMLTVVALSALYESRLEVYLSLFTAVYFGVTVLFRPRRRWFDFVGASLFVVFLSIVVRKIMEILL